MTVSSEVNKAGPYNGNGVTTIFDYGFRIVDETHICVIKRDISGVETTLTLDTDYIVSDVGSSLGGKVALTVAPPVGESLTLLLNIPFTQETDLENQGAYYAETIETALDLAVMRDLELSERLDRTIAIPATADISKLSSLLEDITRLTASADQIDTVASIGPDVTTVAGIASDVTTVAGIAENVSIAAENIEAIIAAPAAATEASAALAEFHSLYLGPFANDAAATDAASGSPATGAEYWNTTSNKRRTWNGAAWDDTPITVGDGAVSRPKLANAVRASLLVNAMRAAESFGSGVSEDGKTFVDLLNATDTLDTAASSNIQFRKGGIEPASAPGAAHTTASATLGGDNPSWTGNTLVAQVTSGGMDGFQADHDFVRLSFKAGTGGTFQIRGVFIGVRLGTSVGEFDPAYPVVPVLFGGSDQVTIAAGQTQASDITRYSIPAGKTVLVAYFVAGGGHAASGTATGWASYYSTAADPVNAPINEPAKYKKSGYTATGTILGLAKIEVFDAVPAAMALVSGELPLSAAPTKTDVTVFLDCAVEDAGDFALSLSRDKVTWKAVALGDLYTVNGKIGRAAYGVDLATGAGAGSALYWKAAPSSGKAIKVTAIALRQEDGIFTDVPSIPARPSAPVVTHHMESTGLGYDTSGTVLYGRLWGFTQDWEVKGPTRFHYGFHAQMIHSGAPSGTVPVAWTLAMTKTYAVDAAAMGAKSYVETDTTPYTGNDFSKWVDFTSGNIANVDEHYKEGFLNGTLDVTEPGVYRFEIWGYSATTADSPPQPDRIRLNWEEKHGISARYMRYNRFEIVAEPLR